MAEVQRVAALVREAVGGYPQELLRGRCIVVDRLVGAGRQVGVDLRGVDEEHAAQSCAVWWRVPSNTQVKPSLWGTHARTRFPSSSARRTLAPAPG